VAVDPLLCVTVLACPTLVVLVEALLNALLSYMLTPFATTASEELTMLMPLAPIRAVPERFTVPVLFSLTVELLAATEEFSSPAAVTLSIWLSRIACLSCLSWVVLDLFWP
jgi:hypothetical protein